MAISLMLAAGFATGTRNLCCKEIARGERQYNFFLYLCMFHLSLWLLLCVELREERDCGLRFKNVLL